MDIFRRKKMEYEKLDKINNELHSIPVKGKEYVEVNTRILAFRKLFPKGRIITELLSIEDGMCVFKANIFDGEILLATGTAYEKENSSFINKTSYVENCETSAIGRALGVLGIGIQNSVASYEEVANAISNQDEKSEEVVMGEITKKFRQLVNKFGNKDKVYSLLGMSRDEFKEKLKDPKCLPDLLLALEGILNA